MAFDEKLAARVRKVLEGRTDVVEKQMFGGVAFMVRGHMSCGIVGSRLMVRVAPEDADAFLREPGVRPMDFSGRPMRGFLYVDPAAIAGAASLRTWVGRSVAHAETRPARPTKRPAPARRKRKGPGAR
jgi:TfoX/Sxy family transcriptional regulator of competence genes